MVAKHLIEVLMCRTGLNLAKIHMVAKPIPSIFDGRVRLNLAKIHMVAKLECTIKV